MTRLWNFIEAHYLIAAFLAWFIVAELSKIIRQFLRTFQLHPDYITHNHIQSEEDSTEDEEEDTEDESTPSSPSSPSNPMLTQPRPQPLPRPGSARATPPSPGLLTRAERVIRNLRG